MAGAWLLHRAVQPLVVVLCSLPAWQLLFKAVLDQLGPNPAEALIRGTGDWTLRWLCVVLAVTPVRILFKLPALARLRRTLGLTVFVYACLHLLCYAWLDMGLEWSDIAHDIAKRPFILVGFVSWLVLLVLAATSSHAAVRWLGGRRWQWLHRAVYLVAPLAILHFYWMRAGKQNFTDVFMYALILVLLLGWRLRRKIRGY
ncbi:MAG: sulfoxide reductase heme-binding subunit YedZ [Limnohabitans sp.]|jgi:sulfoxide reductase heme-binding subunit YedZ|nr:sulfoxide reductase heme-binding subunit YedZ [Limnohabitans sp.]